MVGFQFVGALAGGTDQVTWTSTIIFCALAMALLASASEIFGSIVTNDPSAVRSVGAAVFFFGATLALLAGILLWRLVPSK